MMEDLWDDFDFRPEGEASETAAVDLLRNQAAILSKRSGRLLSGDVRVDQAAPWKVRITFDIHAPRIGFRIRPLVAIQNLREEAEFELESEFLPDDMKSATSFDELKSAVQSVLSSKALRSSLRKMLTLSDHVGTSGPIIGPTVD